jgi:hypothetical protein
VRRRQECAVRLGFPAGKVNVELKALQVDAQRGRAKERERERGGERERESAR